MKTIVRLFIVGALFSILLLAVQADSPITGRAGRTEVRFLQGMIDHHQMALDMATDCLMKAQTDAVRSLCQNILTAQQGEILVMRGWLLSWYGITYEPVSMLMNHQGTAATGGMGMMGGQGGMGMMGGEGGMGMMGGEGGMGMMGGQGGMGMMGGQGNNAMPNMGMMAEMPMERLLAILSLMNTLTVKDLLAKTASMESTTLLMTALNQLLDAGTVTNSPLPALGELTQGRMMLLFAALNDQTLADVQSMVGHLEAGENATLLTMMQHHVDVMGSGGAANDDHAAHHPTEGATPAPHVDHTNHQGATAGMPAIITDPAMTMGMFAGFNRLTGIDYEIAWLEAMIDHHDDALHMAERLLERVADEAGHAELQGLAQKIITAQTAEIAAMEELITELSE